MRKMTKRQTDSSASAFTLIELLVVIAIIATLLAWLLTGDAKYSHWHMQVHDWAYNHFADPEHGEWFGYLHRDGSVSVPLKGNLWKGPFHFPRMQLVCWKLLQGALG